MLPTKGACFAALVRVEVALTVHASRGNRKSQVASVATGLVLLAASACRLDRPSEMPRDEAWIVAVKSCRLPKGMPWYARFAQHTWIDLKEGAEEKWKRIEVASSSAGVDDDVIPAAVARRDHRWERDIELLAEIRGERARAIASRIHEAAKLQESTFSEHYSTWPGPNSNTFVAGLAREIPELRFVFHHNAVGKDYPGWFDAGITASGTGVHVDTLPIGLALGVEEGVELHLLQLTLGVSLVPPRVKLPFLPEIPWPAAAAASTEPPEGATTVVQFSCGETPGAPSGSMHGGQPFYGAILVECVDVEGAWVLLIYSYESGTGRMSGTRRIHVADQDEETPFELDLSHGRANALERLDVGGCAVTIGFERETEQSLGLWVEALAGSR